MPVKVLFVCLGNICRSPAAEAAFLHLAHQAGRGHEFVVDSAKVGIEKPDPGIFRIALDRMGVAAERALFVGDIRSVDEDGARAAGLHFVLIDPHGDYAGADTAAIAGMERLAGWVNDRFEIAPRRPAARGGAPS